MFHIHSSTYDVTYTPPAIEQLGSDIDGAHDDFGYAVSMSNDGNRMVAGAKLDDTPETNAGSVEVYEYSRKLTKMGSTIIGEAGGDEFVEQYP